MARPPLVLSPLARGLVVAAVLGGCGSAGGEPDPATMPQKKEVQLEVLTKTKTTNRDSVLLYGIVTPGARVTVDDEHVRARGNKWSRRVKLYEEGSNYIDILADKPGPWRASSRTFVIQRTLSAADVARQRARRARARAAAAARRAQAKANFMAQAEAIDYDQLIKDPDSFTGRKVKYQGQIFQIQEQGGAGGTMLLAVTNEGYGVWSDNLWVDYKGHIESAADDIITVYGVVKGAHSYETQAGGEAYVPKVEARYIVE